MVDRSTGWSPAFYDSLESRLAEREAAAKERMRERADRLAAAGIECAMCEDTGRTMMGGRFCECAKGQAIDRADLGVFSARIQALVPSAIGVAKRYAAMSFATYPDQSSPALAAVKAWLDAERPELQPGLFVCGAFGRGKTGLIVSAMRELAWRHAQETMLRPGAYYERSGDGRQLGGYATFVTATGLLESLRPHNGETDERLFERYKTVDYLAIDDIGAERLTDWGVDRLFEIVNHRHSELLPMLVSSNLSPGELAKRINKQIGDQSGDRIVERLIESCRVVRFDDAAPNWRLAR